MIDLAPALALRGWMHVEELRWLAEQAARSDTIVEIGCYQGRSTRALADHCAGRVYAVDPWDGIYHRNDGGWHPINTAVYDVFTEHLRDRLEAGRVVPMRCTFREAQPQILAQIGRTVDLVFIDGDHRFETCVDDIAGALDLVRPGGMVAGHDFGHPDWPGVRRAVTQWFGDAVQLHRSIWWVNV